MTDEQTIERLIGKNETLRMEIRALKAEKASEYHRAEKLKAQMLNMGRAIDVLRRHTKKDAWEEAKRLLQAERVADV